jgi:hypothetical protein
MAGQEAGARLDREQATWENQEEAEQAEWRDFERGHREHPDREAGS